MVPGEAAGDSRHGVSQFDREEDFDVGGEREEFSDGRVVGVEPERSLDPVGPIGGRGWLGPGPPSVRPSVDDCELKSGGREADTHPAQAAAGGCESCGRRVDALLERVQELETTVRSTRRVDRDPGAGQRVEVPQHGSLRDLESLGEVAGGVASSVLKGKNELEESSGAHRVVTATGFVDLVAFMTHGVMNG